MSSYFISTCPGVRLYSYTIGIRYKTFQNTAYQLLYLALLELHGGGGCWQGLLDVGGGCPPHTALMLHTMCSTLQHSATYNVVKIFYRYGYQTKMNKFKEI